MNYQKIADAIYQKVAESNNNGELANYIPELAKVNPEKFGAHFLTLNKNQFGVGDFKEKFSIQSMAKVLSLSLAIKLMGEKIWKRVGVEPSGTPFNSLVQLEADKGIPRNPFINSGALVICDILIDDGEIQLTIVDKSTCQIGREQGCGTHCSK